MMTAPALTIFAFALMLSACGNSSAPKSSLGSDNLWYNGGTLHQATIRQWHAATEKNRLATCADFIATMNKDLPFSELKPRATELMECINEATLGLPEVQDSKVSSNASACAVLLGY